MNGYDNTKARGMLQIDTNPTRRHTMKLKKKTRSATNQRVINVWNKLPQKVIDAPTINAFKDGVAEFYGQTKYFMQ